MVFSVYCLVSLFLVENTLFFYERLVPFSFERLAPFSYERHAPFYKNATFLLFKETTRSLLWINEE